MRGLWIANRETHGKRGETCYRLFLDYWPYGFRPLFPNLRCIQYQANYKLISKFAVFVTTSCPLRVIDSWQSPPHANDDKDFDVRSLEKCVQISRDSLQRLFVAIDESLYNIGSGDKLKKTVDEICGVLLELNTLQEGDLLHPLSSASLAHLAQLPNLRSLHFTFAGAYHDPQLLPPRSGNFRSLRRLDIELQDIPSHTICALFDNISGACLEDVTINFHECGGPLAGDLITLLHHISRHRALQSIDISRMDDDSSPQPADSANWPMQCSTILRSLASLDRLHELHIMRFPLHTTADDLRLIASTWPGMKVVWLSSDNTLTTTKVHVADLRLLAAGCSKLSSLHVAVCGACVPSPEDIGSLANGYDQVKDFCVLLCGPEGTILRLRHSEGHQQAFHSLFPKATAYDESAYFDDWDICPHGNLSEEEDDEAEGDEGDEEDTEEEEGEEGDGEEDGGTDEEHL